MSSLLAQPLTLPGGTTLKNRLGKSAMSEQLGGPAQEPTPRLERLYARWSEGGTGLLITGNVMVDRRALGEPGNVALEDERHLDAFRAWAAAAKLGGAVVLMQLNHPGRQSPRNLSPTPVAPSAVPLALGPAFAPPRALTDPEIREIIERFARSAALAQRAGFDGVQLHGAHGYLVSQFLSPRVNLRDDEWGGDAARRRRFLLEILRAVRAATRPGLLLSLKLNSADFQRGGFDEAESMAVLDALPALDLLEISGGTYERPVMWQSSGSTGAREAYFLQYAEKVRARCRLPLMLTGGFRTRAGMEAALSGGAIDLAGLARPLAVEPDLSARLLSGQTDRAAPIDLSTGLKRLDGLLEATWYQVQLARLADGAAPDPGASRWRAVPRILRTALARPRRGY